MDLFSPNAIRSFHYVDGRSGPSNFLSPYPGFLSSRAFGRALFSFFFFFIYTPPFIRLLRNALIMSNKNKTRLKI